MAKKARKAPSPQSTATTRRDHRPVTAAATHQPGADEHQGRVQDGPGQEIALEIDGGQGDEPAHERQLGRQRPAGAEADGGQREQHRGQGFDDRVAHGDGGLALTAPAAEEQPRHHRNVVPRRHRRFRRPGRPTEARRWTARAAPGR